MRAPLHKYELCVAMLQPRRVADGVFCSGISMFRWIGVLQRCNVTATRLAKLFAMCALRFRAIEFVRVRGGALVERKFEVTDLLRVGNIGKRFVRGI